MNISELFENIQDKFSPEDIKGEFILQGNCIVWTYKLEEDLNENDVPEKDEDDFEYCFNSTSLEEYLTQAYDEDLQQLEEFLDELDETNNLSFSDSEIVDDIISFKIF